MASDRWHKQSNAPTVVRPVADVARSLVGGQRFVFISVL